MQPLQPPIYDAPTGPPDWNGENGLEELKKHLQTAVLLELHTIPLYLFAAYSIKEDSSANEIISKSPAYAHRSDEESLN